MNWSSKEWANEDMLYRPKRRVNNHASHNIPHIIGGFYSAKMNRVVEYESLGERLFFYYLELDKPTIRYYVQPVEIPMVEGTDEESSKGHVPDVLVFRQGARPILLQIKHLPGETSKEEDFKNWLCVQYAKNQGWDYDVIYPKTMPRVLLRNIQFLAGFLHPRKYYAELVPELLLRTESLRSCTVRDLSEVLSNRIHPFFVLPAAYYLIAHGQFLTDVTLEIGPESLVSVNTVKGFSMSRGVIGGALPVQGI